MVFFATHYFKNKSYLRIDGRPVVFLYLTRTLTGNVTGMMQGVRKVLARYGVNPFFIGDEVYWRVTPETERPSGPVLTTSPQASRIEQFDAITSYTMYYGDPSPYFGPPADFNGYPGTTNIIADEKRLLERYRSVTDNRVPVIPDVGPGFNDRGVRLAVNHPTQPRQWLAGEGPASTLDHLFREFAIPELDPKLPMIMVTSWNDWNEDTGIEPIPGVQTNVDDSPSRQAYTQGYTYGGEGRAATEALRRDVSLLDRKFRGHASSH
jgi:glycoprotein endo-alpha-1,2-mannosidase